MNATCERLLARMLSDTPGHLNPPGDALASARAILSGGPSAVTMVPNPWVGRTGGGDYERREAFEYGRREVLRLMGDSWESET